MVRIAFSAGSFVLRCRGASFPRELVSSEHHETEQVVEVNSNLGENQIFDWVACHLVSVQMQKLVRLVFSPIENVKDYEKWIEKNCIPG